VINFKLFFFLVLSFITRIVFLIFFGDIALILLGWDGLGLTSFLLVIFYKNRKRLGSGLLTVILNRTGDCFFLLVLAFSLGNGYAGSVCPTRRLILILLSITKSAQFPFSSWLPAAIAAPTPVSALVHSSTLVTAGVFILIRFSSGLPFYWLLFIGSLTMILAGFSAFFENDIKKIVALSTLSQLGVIIVSISMGLVDFTFFHLCTHAIFKALIFLCVGVAIHSVWGSQDLRSYGSLRFGIAYPYILLILASTSLLGFPFISGFYSKDLIVESFVNINQSLLFLLIFLVGIGLTAGYSVKLIKNLSSPLDQNCRRMLSLGGFNLVVGGPLILLGVLSVFSGSILSVILELNFNLFAVWDKVIPLFFIFLGVTAGFSFFSLSVRASSIFFLVPSSQLTSGVVEYSNMLRLDNGFVSSICSSSIFYAAGTSRSLFGGVAFLFFIFYFV